MTGGYRSLQDLRVQRFTTVEERGRDFHSRASAWPEFRNQEPCGLANNHDMHLNEIILRLIVGGAIVSVFSFLGCLLKPKSFAGLFGAAPSVALATLALTVVKDGKVYASVEGRSMILGAVAFCAYSYVVSFLLIRRRVPVLATAASVIVLWLACAFGLWYVVLA